MGKHIYAFKQRCSKWQQLFPPGCNGLKSAKRSTLVAVIGEINAVGNAIPPCYIFPRVHFSGFMVDGASPWSARNAHPRGYVNEDIFLNYFKRFVKHAKV